MGASLLILGSYDSCPFRAMIEKTEKRVPFPVDWCTGMGVVTLQFPSGPRNEAVRGTGKTLKKAKEALSFFSALNEAIIDVTNPLHLVMCRDGTLLLVYSEGGRWGYLILREGSESSAFGDENLEEAIGHARKHAEQCFAGVAWEKSIKLRDYHVKS